ncbi:MAG: HesA/MoeB/ThiF family protein [Atribacterota bacterium]|nr:HesA/MoeB/ThiF family protein [Atribacterota bacterium]
MKNKNIKEIINELGKIKEKQLSQKSFIFTITTNQVKHIAKKYSLSPLEVEILSLQQDIMPTRYERNYDTISFSDQIKLLQSTVAVVGCGGLGGNIVELLARTGIGNIAVIDGDIFNESNLNRQLLCTEHAIGIEKAEKALERIKHINSSINTTSYSCFIDSENVREIISGSDIVVDALDNIPSRFIIEEGCKKLKIPFIHGAVGGFIGQVSTIFPEDKGLQNIYGPKENYTKDNSENRLSVLPASPALIASLEVQEVLKVLLNRGTSLRNKLLLINLEDVEFNVLELP